VTITPVRSLPRASWRPWLTGIESLLASGLLVVALCSAARAESALTPLLKPLDLVAYRADTMPPQLTGHTLDARPVSLADFRGKVLVVNFWASWCLECRPEMPVLERLHRELGPRGLVVIGVNARENKAAIARYARELGLTFPLVLDPDGRMSQGYGVVGLPTTFLVGRDGRAVAFGVGAREWGSAPARTLIEALLTELVPPTAR
jgi:cytochrome c biogenesis protein CcmG/thiol:disulfide interchange protein DsbE